MKREAADIGDPAAQWLLAHVMLEEQNTSQEISDGLQRIWLSRYRRIPVRIREFIGGRPYLNLSIGEAVDPQIVEALETVFGGYCSEVMLTGSITWDKITFGALAFAYDLYRLSCMKDPAVTYGMKTGSNFTFLNLSVTKRHAESEFFARLRDLICRSRYFTNAFRYERCNQTKILFPMNVACYPVAASEQVVLGVGLFCAFIDEVNEIHAIGGSRRRPGSGGVQNTDDPAEDLFKKLRARMSSRFALNGRTAGHLYASSSASEPDPFTQRRIEEARREGQDNALCKPEQRRDP